MKQEADEEVSGNRKQRRQKADVAGSGQSRSGWSRSGRTTKRTKREAGSRN